MYSFDPNSALLEGASSYFSSQESLTPELLYEYFHENPDLFSHITFAAAEGYPGILNQIAPLLDKLTKPQVFELLSEPGDLPVMLRGCLANLGVAAKLDHSLAILTLKPVIASFTKDELLQVLRADEQTLHMIASAEIPEMIDCISNQLSNFTKDELLSVMQCPYDKHMPANILSAVIEVSSSHPDALAAMVNVLFSNGPLSVEELNLLRNSEHKKDDPIRQLVSNACRGLPHSLRALVSMAPTLVKHFSSYLAELSAAACRGCPAALNAVAGTLGALTADELSTLLLEQPRVIEQLTFAANCGAPNALVAISPVLCQIPKPDFINLFKSPCTLSSIFDLATEGQTQILDIIMPKLLRLSDSDWENIFTASHLAHSSILLAIEANISGTEKLPVFPSPAKRPCLMQDVSRPALSSC